MTMQTIQGAKGGSSTRTPVESPDNLRSIAYFRILDLVSEGEIGGLVNGLQSIYLDQTPLANIDGSLNFSNVQVVAKTGTQDQDYIPGYPAVENEISIGVELKSTSAWVRSITNTQLSAARVTIGVPGLSQVNTSNGDVTGYTVKYQIEVQTDGGAYQLAYTGAFTGKTTSKYQRSHRIDLPVAVNGWNLRITRLTANANSSSIQDTTTIDSYTEVIDAKLRYPNSALIAISGDASQFTNIPARAYDMWGRIIQVPSNYDPLARTYSGVWDGTFKPAWSNNPAWVYYDIATHKRYGLGHLIDPSQVNKWALYQIAQYCDQLVSDGKGGQEPRFTCNIFLQSAEDAYKALSDLASIFRGISYWAAGSITASADMPADPVYVYTAANVINGDFSYSDSARKTRYTTATVTWNDPNNFYQQAVEYVQNDPGLARYGIIPLSITAFGCTSQAQAQRAGQWALLTAQLETDTVTFKVGLDGMIAAPGQIIRVQDQARAGKRQGGRISAATATVITVDRAPDAVSVGDRLTVVLPTGVSETQAITAINGRSLTVAGFSVAPAAQSAWMVESDSLAAQTFRVVNVTEDKSDSDISFTITAVQHNASKFDAIDNGAIIQIPPISSLPASVQVPPTNVAVSGNVVTMQGIATNVLTISWDAPDGAAQYQVSWRKDSGDWVQAGTVTGTSCDVQGIYTGNYQARVYAINNAGVTSLPALSAITAVQGKTGAPPALASLKTSALVFGIGLSWTFPPGCDDTQRTEIWYSTTPDITTANKLSDFAYPQSSYQMQGLAAGVSFFFWGRMVDKTGNIGPWYPTGAGVNGQSSSDAGDVLSYLNGQIGKTQLAQDLLTPIEGIAPAMSGDPDAFAGDSTSFAGVWSQLSAQQDGDAALAQRIDAVVASVNNNMALIQTETSARITDSSVTASQITTVQASITTTNNNLAQTNSNLAQTTATVQTNATAVANLSGQVNAAYNIKVGITSDGKYYGAGIAVGVSNASGVAQSQILFLADQLAFITSSAGGTTYTPFAIVGGQVFIQQAFIQDGSITNAKIGGMIVSNAVDSTGNPLWSINKDGAMTMRGSTSGSFRTERDGNGARLYDGNGTLRMRWGAW
jgi:predicted phage tail protein